MSYLHIPNLYKDTTILLFKKCYAMEKIHGTSAHISWDGTKLGFFSGGVSHEDFVNLFDSSVLSEGFDISFHNIPVLVYGEAYGGKCQGMSATYGKALHFVAFEVKVMDMWLSVPKARDVVMLHLGIDFVPYNEIPADMEHIDAERDEFSEQAKKRGMGNDKMREGIVLRPLIEVTMNNGERVIAKHRRPEFSERASNPNIDPSKRQRLEDGKAIADEWVVPRRLQHVLDSLKADSLGYAHEWVIQDTGIVIKAMLTDVLREATGEIAENDSAKKAISVRAAHLFHEFLRSGLYLHE